MRSVTLEHCFWATVGSTVVEAAGEALDLLSVLEPKPYQIYLIVNTVLLPLQGPTKPYTVDEICRRYDEECRR